MPAESRGLFSRTVSGDVLERTAWLIWSSMVVVLTAKVLFRPTSSITHIYSAATRAWWQGGDLYGPGIHGFLYLPSSAILFTPFTWPPLWLGDMVWRLVLVGMFTWAMIRLAPLMAGPGWRRALAWALLLAMPAATVNVMRSQTEIMLAALMMHGAVDIAHQRWRAAAAWLALAVAVKPLALVMALLAGAAYRPLRPWLVLGLAVAVALPFLNPDPDYVIRQYAGLVDKLLTAGDPGEGRWNEIGMMLARFGINLSAGSQLLLRAGAALVTLVAALLAVRRHPPAAAALRVLGLAVCYLLVFNPRTELGSYMNLAALLGLYAGARWQANRHDALGWTAALLALATGTHMYGDWIYRPTDVWLKPLVACLVLGILVIDIIARRRPPAGAPALPAAERLATEQQAL